MPNRLAVTAAAFVAAIVAGGCATPTENFRDQTEDYLEESPVVAGQFGDAGVTDASCERPDDTAIGTTYRCTAQVAGQGTVSFTIQITAEDEFSIVGFSD